MALRLSISGARGVVGETLTPDVISYITTVFSDYINHGAVLLGRDTRPTGAPIEHLVTAILSLLGRDVVIAGVLPTPTIALCTTAIDAAGAIAITASHNPEQWNALKLIDGNGMFLPPDFWQSLRVEQTNSALWAAHDEIGRITSLDGCVLTHLERIFSLPYIDIGELRDAHFRVAYDGVGGAGPAIIIPLLREIGAEIINIGQKMDGNFIHSPEPIPENLKMLSELVTENEADIGVATDPDADRLAIVDETGRPIGEEFTVALAAEQVLSHCKSDIVVNLSTSTIVDWLAERYGCGVHRTAVGEYWVSNKMLELGCAIGGEGNGGVIVPEVHPVRDSATALALILSLLARNKEKLSQIVAQFPQKIMIKEKVHFAGDFEPIESRILEVFAPEFVDRSDGVWFRVQDGFAHIRQSNTEPVIRIIVESNAFPTAQEVVQNIVKIVRSYL